MIRCDFYNHIMGCGKVATYFYLENKKNKLIALCLDCDWNKFHLWGLNRENWNKYFTKITQDKYFKYQVLT